ncbi:protein of unknown function [Oenococcus oeni]|uniref:Uncharacterized protein n=1 Tax=Oenococcus oeni TaxID=1247 RepID=A0AAQ2USX6_OENOE|nr:hypothetical protein OENI_210022 [Oenococcus oeni]VDB98623.1 protein of unknown function [Oenococcus oeni]VDC15096.1 protein of unknown function [Oenococcus oeni]
MNTFIQSFHFIHQFTLAESILLFKTQLSSYIVVFVNYN